MIKPPKDGVKLVVLGYHFESPIWSRRYAFDYIRWNPQLWLADKMRNRGKYWKPFYRYYIRNPYNYIKKKKTVIYDPPTGRPILVVWGVAK